MSDHEMLNLDEMGCLKESMELLQDELMNNHRIDPNLYVEYDVKRGLRDSAGKGVLTGLTEISDVTGYNLVNGRKIPAHGRLYYQGYNVNELIEGLNGRKFGFEETIYLLLFGRLPSEKDMEMFKEVMENFETLSGRFVRDVVMKASNAEMHPDSLYLRCKAGGHFTGERSSPVSGNDRKITVARCIFLSFLQTFP